VPRLYTKFYDAINGKFEKTEGIAKILVDRALETKIHNVEATGVFHHQIYDRLVFNKTKQALGGHIKTMISGSAPLLPRVHSFMKVITVKLKAPVQALYQLRGIQSVGMSVVQL
jgi:long-chain acyl-CoA synthetase